MSATLLGRLMARRDLSRAESAELVGRIMDGELEPPAIAALLVAFAMKGETPEELAGAAEAMRARSVRVVHRRPDAIDTCGTGGDGRGTFNVSTAAAFVVAAAGGAVAKHGNRAISSRSGSADLLAALGVPLEVPPEIAAQQLEEIGVAFLFAPAHHPAMRQVAPVRRALGVRTLFNLLGPLTNPAGAKRQLLGVYARDRVEPVARVLAELGCEHGLVVHGEDGLDEITVTGATYVAEVRVGEVLPAELTPEEIGVARAGSEELAGGTPEENARTLERLLAGELAGGLVEIVAANAGAALYVAGRAGSIAEGVATARELLARGAPRERLEALRTFDATESGTR